MTEQLTKAVRRDAWHVRKAFILFQALLVASNAWAQGLTDEKQLLQQQRQTEMTVLVKRLQIPDDICAMQLVLTPSYRQPLRMTFCQYVQLWVQRMSRLDPTAKFLPMLKWKPRGQLVEMVGIPTDRRPERDAFGASLFKNSGGQLILAAMIDHCEQITTNDAKCRDVQILDGSSATQNNDTMAYFLTEDPR
jgi:hypothetical protein